MGSEFLSFIIHFRVGDDKCHVNEMRHRCYYFCKRNNSTRHWRVNKWTPSAHVPICVTIRLGNKNLVKLFRTRKFIIFWFQSFEQIEMCRRLRGVRGSCLCTRRTEGSINWFIISVRQCLHPSTPRLFGWHHHHHRRLAKTLENNLLQNSKAKSNKFQFHPSAQIFDEYCIRFVSVFQSHSLCPLPLSRSFVSLEWIMRHTRAPAVSLSHPIWNNRWQFWFDYFERNPNGISVWWCLFVGIKRVFWIDLLCLCVCEICPISTRAGTRNTHSHAHRTRNN